MRRFFIVFILALSIGAGCSDDQNPLRQYGKTLTGSLGKAEKAKIVADLRTIRAEIVRYKSENGEYPPTIEALNLPNIYPGAYNYNSETGEVTQAQ